MSMTQSAWNRQPSLAPEEGQQWEYLGPDGVVYGPFTLEHLQQWLDKRYLSPDQQVRIVGTPGWVELSKAHKALNVKEDFPSLGLGGSLKAPTATNAWAAKTAATTALTGLQQRNSNPPPTQQRTPPKPEPVTPAPAPSSGRQQQGRVNGKAKVPAQQQRNGRKQKSVGWVDDREWQTKRRGQVEGPFTGPEMRAFLEDETFLDSEVLVKKSDWKQYKPLEEVFDIIVQMYALPDAEPAPAQRRQQQHNRGSGHQVANHTGRYPYPEDGADNGGAAVWDHGGVEIPDEAPSNPYAAELGPRAGEYGLGGSSATSTNSQPSRASSMEAGLPPGLASAPARGPASGSYGPPPPLMPPAPAVGPPLVVPQSQGQQQQQAAAQLVQQPAGAGTYQSAVVPPGFSAQSQPGMAATAGPHGYASAPQGAAAIQSQLHGLSLAPPPPSTNVAPGAPSPAAVFSGTQATAGPPATVPKGPQRPSYRPPLYTSQQAPSQPTPTPQQPTVWPSFPSAPTSSHPAAGSAPWGPQAAPRAGAPAPSHTGVVGGTSRIPPPGFVGPVPAAWGQTQPPPQPHLLASGAGSGQVAAVSQQHAGAPVGSGQAAAVQGAAPAAPAEAARPMTWSAMNAARKAAAAKGEPAGQQAQQATAAGAQQVQQAGAPWAALHSALFPPEKATVSAMEAPTSSVVATPAVAAAVTPAREPQAPPPQQQQQQQ